MPQPSSPTEKRVIQLSLTEDQALLVGAAIAIAQITITGNQGIALGGENIEYILSFDQYQTEALKDLFNVLKSRQSGREAIEWLKKISIQLLESIQT